MLLIANSVKKERETVAISGEAADIYFCASLNLFYLNDIIIYLSGIRIRNCLPILQYTGVHFKTFLL